MAKIIPISAAQGDFDLKSKGWIEDGELWASNKPKIRHLVINRYEHEMFEGRDFDACATWMKTYDKDNVCKYRRYVVTEEDRNVRKEIYRYQQAAPPTQRHNVHVLEKERARDVSMGQPIAAFWDEEEDAKQIARDTLKDAFKLLALA